MLQITPHDEYWGTNCGENGGFSHGRNGQTEDEPFFSVSPVTSVLMLFSVSSAVFVPASFLNFVFSVIFVAQDLRVSFWLKARGSC